MNTVTTIDSAGNERATECGTIEEAAAAFATAICPETNIGAEPAPKTPWIRREGPVIMIGRVKYHLAWGLLENLR